MKRRLLMSLFMAMAAVLFCLPAAGAVRSFANAAALAAYAAGSIENGETVYVETFRDSFILNRSIRPTADGVLTIAASGSGVWERLRIPHPSWMNQRDWVIDEANSTSVANDENSCVDAEHPCRTAAERRRRMGSEAQWRASTVYHLRYISTCAGDVIDGDVGASTAIYLHASMTDRAGDLQFSGTFTAVTALDTATNVPWSSTSASIPVSWATAGLAGVTLVDRRIRIASGTNINAVAHITKDLGGAAPAAAARFSEFLTPVASFNVAPFANPGTATAGPSNGDTFVVEDLRTISTLNINARALAAAASPPRIVIDSIVTTMYGTSNVAVYADGSQVVTAASPTFTGNYTLHQCKLSGNVDFGFKNVVGGYVTVNGVYALQNDSGSTGTIDRVSLGKANSEIQVGGTFGPSGGLVWNITQVGMFDLSFSGLIIKDQGARLSSAVIYGSGNLGPPIQLQGRSMLQRTSLTAPISFVGTAFCVVGQSPFTRTSIPVLDESGNPPVWTAPRECSLTNIAATVAAGGLGINWMDPQSGAGMRQ